MKKFVLIIILATILIIGGGVLLVSKDSGSSQAPPSRYEFYYSNSCPHCANVEDFLETWEGTAKISLEKMEAWYDKENAELLNSRAASCGIARSEIGVPFLVTPEGKCLVGDTPIIDHLKTLNFDEKSS